MAEKESNNNALILVSIVAIVAVVAIVVLITGNKQATQTYVAQPAQLQTAGTIQQNYEEGNLVGDARYSGCIKECTTYIYNKNGTNSTSRKCYMVCD